MAEKKVAQMCQISAQPGIEPRTLRLECRDLTKCANNQCSCEAVNVKTTDSRGSKQT